MTIFIVEVCVNGVWVPDVNQWYDNHPSAHEVFERRQRSHPDEQYRVAMYERTAPRTGGDCAQ